MADSKRQRIVDAIVARMKLINGVGDYTTDLAERVNDWQTNWAQDQGQLPAVTIFDGDAVANLTSPAAARGTVNAMSVLIRGFTEQAASPTAARTLIKDIMTAIRQDDKWHVGGVPLAMQSRPVRDGIVRGQDTFEVEGCEIEIEVHYLTQKFNAE